MIRPILRLEVFNIKPDLKKLSIVENRIRTEWEDFLNIATQDNYYDLDIYSDNIHVKFLAIYKKLHDYGTERSLMLSQVGEMYSGVLGDRVDELQKSRKRIYTDELEENLLLNPPGRRFLVCAAAPDEVSGTQGETALETAMQDLRYMFPTGPLTSFGLMVEEDAKLYDMRTGPDIPNEYPEFFEKFLKYPNFKSDATRKEVVKFYCDQIVNYAIAVMRKIDMFKLPLPGVETREDFAIVHMFTKLLEDLGYNGLIVNTIHDDGGCNVILFDEKYLKLTKEKPELHR